MKYSIEQLKAMGMDDVQINAIMHIQNGAHEGVGGQPTGSATTQPEVVKYQPALVEDVPMKVTSIADLHAYGQGKVIRLPDFAEGQPFVARMRRPSLLVLAKQGKIPNALLNSANQLFSNGGGGMDADNPRMLADIYEICEVVARAALLEPTYDEIEQSGVELSDDQLMAIFSYTQNGIKALSSFR